MKHLFCTFTFLLLFNSISYSQMTCGTEDTPAGYQTQSSPCIDMDIDEVPIKTVRVSFHIFQKDDGSENIQNNSVGNDYLDAIEWSMNHFMSNLPMFDYTTSSPYYADSKIRYEVVDTHFWQNTEMWSKGDDKTTSRGNALYNFVMAQSIPYKNTSVHLFMPGNFSGIEQEFGGVACDIPCNRWSTTIGVYYKFINSDPTNRNHWDPGKTFCHELGHNFGLYHTFSGDNCSDTPPLCKRCTNNMMDYEETKSLTQCQLSKMHKWLETHTAIVKAGLPNYTMSGQVTWSGGSASLFPVLNNVPDPQITVDINAPGASSFTWNYINGNGTWSTNGSGTVTNVNIALNDYMEFDVETLANCQSVDETYVFIHQPYLLFPNPVQDQLNIQQNRKFQEISSRYDQKSASSHGLKYLINIKRFCLKRS